MRNPYEVLEVPLGASDDEIKAAYRAAAKRYHPDNNPGDVKALRRFHELSSAYALLKDAETRRRYDRGEIDSAGNPRQSGHASGRDWRRWSQPFEERAAKAETPPEPPRPRRKPAPPPKPNSPRWTRERRAETAEKSAKGGDNMFADLFSRRAGQKSEPGEDIELPLLLSFEEAALGGRKRVALEGRRQVDVLIPAGIESGQQIRLKAQGKRGRGGAPAGDAILTARVAPHPDLVREGRNIRLDWPISVYDAALGVRVPVPTIHGPVTLKIPAGSQGGTILRLKGKGLPAAAGTSALQGDQLVTLRLMLPERINDDLQQLLQHWRRHHPYDPRRGA